MKLTLTAIILFLFTAVSAQSFQVGYYVGESFCRNTDILASSNGSSTRDMFSNNINIKWTPKRKLNVEAGFGYYFPWTKLATYNFIDPKRYGTYNEDVKEKLHDHEYYITVYDRIFQSKNKRFNINVGGSLTLIPEEVSGSFRYYTVPDSTEINSGTDWRKLQFLFFGVNAEATYKINTRLSISASFAFKFQEDDFLLYYSKGDSKLLYDVMPDTYSNVQLGLNYTFKY